MISLPSIYVYVRGCHLFLVVKCVVRLNSHFVCFNYSRFTDFPFFFLHHSFDRRDWFSLVCIILIFNFCKLWKMHIGMKQFCYCCVIKIFELVACCFFVFVFIFRNDLARDDCPVCWNRNHCCSKSLWFKPLTAYCLHFKCYQIWHASVFMLINDGKWNDVPNESKPTKSFNIDWTFVELISYIQGGRQLKYNMR